MIHPVYGPTNNRIGIPYVVIHDIFNVQECAAINQTFDQYDSSNGMVGHIVNGQEEYSEDHDFRKCGVTYAKIDDQNEWIHFRIRQCMVRTNDLNWNCDITDFDEPLRRMSYGAHDHFKSWHPDYGMEHTGFRKLTGVVLLDDPSTFEGGKFEIACWGEIDLRQGSCIVFPTYIYHRVTPVISGLRRSLVQRAMGPTFK